jgi:hypothetical protein
MDNAYDDAPILYAMLIHEEFKMSNINGADSSKCA